MKKRILPMLLALCLLLSACGTQQTNNTPTEPTTHEFTDSTGRTVTVPAEITKIAVSGPLTQIYILPLAGDMLVGVSNRFAEDAEIYLPEYIFEKEEIGQLYGGKGELDLEALLAADPDIVIDIGETKDSMKSDLDQLTEQTGIPFVHIYATVSTTNETYRTLGELLGREEQAEALASWCENTLASIEELMDQVDAEGARKGILYCLGDTGTNVMAEGSFHAETVNVLGNNLAVVENVVSHGNGNEVDLEQIMVWDPDVIVFSPDSCYDTVGTAAEWQNMTAIAEGNYYKEPYGPYGWLSSPPSVQRYLGMLWLGELLYPDYVTYDLQEQVTEYYKLFYDCELTDEMYQALIKDAL